MMRSRAESEDNAFSLSSFSFEQMEWGALEVIPVYENPSDGEGKLGEQLNARLGPWAEFHRGLLLPQEAKDQKPVAYYEELLKSLEEEETKAKEEEEKNAGEVGGS